jgi:uncharacterized protein (DUF1778 family)
MSTIIDKLYVDSRDLVGFLDSHEEISLRSSADDAFRRTLLVSAASHYEAVVKEFILDLVSEHANRVVPISELIKNKVIERQFHTFFDWKARNANKFFGMFGEGFSSFMKAQVSSSPELEASIVAFMELGQLRNELVHQNFAMFPLEKTAEEIYGLYSRARLFVDTLPVRMRQYVGGCHGSYTAESSPDMAPGGQ